MSCFHKVQIKPGNQLRDFWQRRPLRMPPKPLLGALWGALSQRFSRKRFAGSGRDLLRVIEKRSGDFRIGLAEVVAGAVRERLKSDFEGHPCTPKHQGGGESWAGMKRRVEGGHLRSKEACKKSRGAQCERDKKV